MLIISLVPNVWLPPERNEFNNIYLPVKVASTCSLGTVAVMLNGPPMWLSAVPNVDQLVPISVLRLGGLWSNRRMVKAASDGCGVGGGVVGGGVGSVVVVVGTSAAPAAAVVVCVVVVDNSWLSGSCSFPLLLLLLVVVAAVAVRLMSKRNPIISEFHEPRMLQGEPTYIYIYTEWERE